MTSKKLLAMLMALIMVLGAFGCAAKEEPAPAAPAAPATEAAKEEAAPAPAPEEKPAEKKKEVKYTIGTAGASGVHYAVGTLMSDAINQNSDYLRLFPQVTGGGEENGRNVQEGEYEFGFWAVDSITMAYEGKGELQLPDLRGVMTVQCNAAQYIVRKDAGIDTWADCKGKKIGIGTTSTIGEMITRAILLHYGIDWDKDLARTEVLPQAEAREKLEDGDLDMIYIAGGYPMAAIVELMTTGDYKIMSTPAEDLEAVINGNYVDYKFGTYGVYTIGADVYPNMTEAVTVPGGRLLIFTREDVPEDDVYEFLKTVYEQWDVIKEGHLAIRDLDWAQMPMTGIPLHPGAEKFYSEVGLLPAA